MTASRRSRLPAVGPWSALAILVVVVAVYVWLQRGFWPRALELLR